MYVYIHNNGLDLQALLTADAQQVRSQVNGLSRIQPATPCLPSNLFLSLAALMS